MRLFNSLSPEIIDFQTLLATIEHKVNNNIQPEGQHSRKIVTSFLSLCKEEAIIVDTSNYNKMFSSEELSELHSTNEISDTVISDSALLWKKIKTYTGKNYLNKLKGHLYCPICGLEIGNKGTIDHVLPKSDFIHFIAYPKNLVWICKNCNSNKDNYYCEPNQLFHPYIHNSDAINIQNVSCTYISNSENNIFLNYKLNIPSEITNECTLRRVTNSFYAAYKLPSSYYQFFIGRFDDRIGESFRALENSEELLNLTDIEKKQFILSQLESELILPNENDEEKHILSISLTAILDNINDFYINNIFCL